MTPETGHVVTVFRSRLLPEAEQTYTRHAAAIAELARAMPGYVEHKIFTAPDGERVTLVTFTDQACHDAWREHPTHRLAQRAGIEGYYSEYSVAVATVHHATAFSRPD